ncbi:hypothetical protein [Sedimentibacter sp.]|uniref:hypothetical protein n=1 Tax=Sedimentibacter sp. TaxID=1960295 RepID=UPI0028A04CC4|nr:hypothetical protein [Sedimentibacter sp.]
MLFLLNDVIHFKGSDDSYERILWISSNNEACTTIELNTTKIILTNRNINELNQLRNDGVAELCNDNFRELNFYNEKELKLKDEIKRDKAYEIVKCIFEQEKEPYLFNAHIRRKLILEACQKFNVSDVVVYKYLRLFWQGGKTKNSLIPKYRNCGCIGQDKNYKLKTGRWSDIEIFNGEKEGVIVDKQIKSIFETTINRYFNNDKEINLSKAHELMKMYFFTDKSTGKVLDASKIPTLRQLRYYYHNTRNLKDEIIKRKGIKRYSLDFRPLPSNSTHETFGPGHRYQLDATVADVYLVSRIDRRSIIGRPILYLVVDVFSRVIAGIHVGLEGPSWNGAASAIYNCCEDKVEFCKKFGIEITSDQWPSMGLPQIILGDRGEMVGPIGEKVIENLNVILENTPSFRGDAKGIVEKNFDTINHSIKHWTPGAIKKEYRERGQRDYRLDAVLDIEDFTKIIIHAVLEKNNNPIESYPIFQEMIDDCVNPIPTEIWSWGMKNRSGYLQRVAEDLLKMSLMRRGSATIDKTGIIFKKVKYSSNTPEEYNSLLKARALGSKRKDIVYDNRDMSTIFMIESNKLIPFTVKDGNKMFKNRAFEEIEDRNFMSIVQRYNLTNRKNQNKVDMNVAIKNVVEEAKKKQKGYKIKKGDIKNIREYRKEENYEVRKNQSLSNVGKVSDKDIMYSEKIHLNESNRSDSDTKALDFIKNMIEGKAI